MNFRTEQVDVPGPLLIHGKRYVDSRGWFAETWSRDALRQLGVCTDFVQDNQSLSRTLGTLRGLHFQKAPYEQAKLVRVLSGAIFDVAVDLRADSGSFGRWCGVHLRAEAETQFFVPRGFAHGFVTLAADTIVAYRVDATYHPASDSGVRWDDETIGVAWPSLGVPLTLSEKDRRLPSLAELLQSATGA